MPKLPGENPPASSDKRCMKNIMKTWLVMSSVFLIAAMMLSGCDMKNSGKAVMKEIVVVDVNKVFRDSRASGLGRAHLEQVKFSLEKGAEALSEIYGEKGTHASEKTMSEGLQRLQLQYQAEEQAVNQIIGDMLSMTTRAWVEKHPGATVIAQSQVLATDSSNDITAQILDEMNRVSPVFGTVPSVEIKQPEVKDSERVVEGGAVAPEKEKKGPAHKDKKTVTH